MMASPSEKKQSIRVRFLGVGGASQEGLGHASAVIEVGGKTLLIDCGPGTTAAFFKHYAKLPDAIFITHCHLDHVGDFENMFVKCWFHQPNKHRPRVFISSEIIPLFNKRVGYYPAVLAEGGVNFWDAFQLVACEDYFIFENLRFNLLEVRHHAPKSAYGLLLKEQFFYTGDTRPIPEVIEHSVNAEEVIFHDCGVVGNPSHSGIDDVLREYSPGIRQRLRCYHYYNKEDVEHYSGANLKVVAMGECFEFTL
ncbi:MAG: MBL fold metallo-hydrolase [Agarilytica sp.]